MQPYRPSAWMQGTTPLCDFYEQYTTYFLFPLRQSPSVFIKHVNNTLIFLPICDCVLKDRSHAPVCLHGSDLNIKVEYLPCSQQERSERP